ncbi:MAG: mevalonate kinase [candidate division KSB1 bacterium]|nr:mevalonate kinase [candidate division KSB1 bacterium]MDZ7336477.1 mevalonate kinase [candidate division KSB1 bacterium]MDZ7357256.1 mevalonate kinase [candidate division KSB1 bacterium]MDZ7377060.1 mevalonate kinase [candidate division KSB1 bacterium]MDZ7402116.1 mevalonate kinase [candidate division KSB1 bacterium]
MISTHGSASAKVILFGEHAVVYGQPAVAIPIQDVRASAAVSIDASVTKPVIEAKDLKIEVTLGNAPYPEAVLPIIKVIELIDEKIVKLPKSGWRLTIWSKIPIGRGLGSSAAISIAIIRALTKAMMKFLSPKDLIKYSFELEKIHHGTPSGIDNTVISLEKPILFRKDHEPAAIPPSSMFFVVGDTGVSKKTSEIVAQVAEARAKNPEQYDHIFSQIGTIARQGSLALKEGDVKRVGKLMNENQILLQRIDVSSPELENLIDAAKVKGALGAKLCGAGKGGCMVAVAQDGITANNIASELLKAGAVRSFTTKLK